jgi:hypothetical protein
MAADPPLRASAAFHCQQAVEKLLKGFLYSGREAISQDPFARPTGRGRASELLGHRLARGSGRDWTVWAVAYRYPLAEGPDETEPDDDERRRAVYS